MQIWNCPLMAKWMQNKHSTWPTRSKRSFKNWKHKHVLLLTHLSIFQLALSLPKIKFLEIRKALKNKNKAQNLLKTYETSNKVLIKLLYTSSSLQSCSNPIPISLTVTVLAGYRWGVSLTPERMKGQERRTILIKG